MTLIYIKTKEEIDILMDKIGSWPGTNVYMERHMGKMMDVEITGNQKPKRFGGELSIHAFKEISYARRSDWFYIVPGERTKTLSIKK